jgi:ABC-type sugar transport system ATPase subunit
MQIPDAQVQPEPLLSVRHLRKSFGHVHAVDDVSLDIFPREVVGVIGDNGAGKSTFLSLLTGYYRADSGEFIYKGHPVPITSPKTSRRNLKIEMIYQDLRLAPDLQIQENLFLGEEPRILGLLLDRRRMYRAAASVLQRLNVNARPIDLLSRLSGGEQQAVAIGRALLFDRDIILMDEPTAAISVNKVQDVLRMIKELKEQGKTIILVSHRLEDILEVADRIVVFFHGRVRAVVKNEGLRISDLVHLMFGAEPEKVREATTAEMEAAPRYRPITGSSD